MAGFVFNDAAQKLLSNSIDWSANTIKARLVETADTLDRDDDVMTGLGLAATDVTLTGKSGPTKDDATDRVKYFADNPTFAAVAAGAEINRVLVFKFVTNDADSIPIAVCDITAVTPNGGSIGVTWNDPTADELVFYSQQ